MKRWLAYLIAILAVLAAVHVRAAHAEPKQQLAWYSDGGGELQGYWVGNSALPSLTFLQCTSIGDGTASPSSSLNVGTASSTRATIIGIFAEDSASVFSVTGVTVGGDAASEIVETATTLTSDAAIYALNNPVGTSETVQVTFDEAISATVIVCLWAANDLSSLTAVSVNSGEHTSSGVINANLSATSADGIAVAITGNTNGSAETVTLVGVTQNGSVTNNGASNAVSAHTAPTAGGALTVSADWTNNGDASLAVAAFR